MLTKLSPVANMHLSQTPMFDSGENFRVSTTDLSHHVTFMKDVNKRLPAGSKWVIEVGHNGNGNIEVRLRPAVVSKPS